MGLNITAEQEVVQFVPLVSRLDAGFWHELSRRKLEKYHLSEAAQYISGYYTNSRLHTRKSQICCGGFLQAVVSYMYVYLSDSVPGLPANFLLEYSAFQQYVLMIHKLILMYFQWEQ